MDPSGCQSGQPAEPLRQYLDIFKSLPHRVTTSLPNAGQTHHPKSPTHSLLPKGVHVLDVDDLQSIVSQQSVIIDVRPFQAYSKSRIRDSIHLAVPSTLVKRASYSLNCIINSIPTDSPQKALLTEYMDECCDKEPLKVVVYDQESTSGCCSAFLYHIFAKFTSCNCHHGGFELYCLNGGFASMQNHTLIDSDPLAERPASPNSANLALVSPSKPSLFGGFTLPSATPSNQKFLLALGAKSTPKEEKGTKFNYKFKLPDGIKGNVDRLPEWLRFLATADESKIVDILNDRFTKIERAEKVRLETAIGSVNPPHSPLVCTPSALCPACDSTDYELPRGIENGYKNRYKNIWPYEHSRVKVEGHQDDDYINANYISFEELSDLTYIATQNPLQATYEDFWNLIHTNNTNIIICLNKQHPAALVGQERKYFDSQTFSSSGMEVQKVSVENHGDLVVRALRLIKEGSPVQKVYQIEYKTWPDFGVPDSFSAISELLSFKNSLIERENLNKQTVVHCSAGCGRTGCFITTDMVLDRLKTQRRQLQDGKVDVWGADDLIYKSVQLQRTQRVSMVQNLRQFILCYEVVLNEIADKYLTK